MKYLLLCVAMCFALGASGSSVYAGESKDKAKEPVNTKCPVAGEDVDPKVVTEHDGKTIVLQRMHR